MKDKNDTTTLYMKTKLVVLVPFFAFSSCDIRILSEGGSTTFIRGGLGIK
jgi:hypothetical protein